MRHPTFDVKPKWTDGEDGVLALLTLSFLMILLLVWCWITLHPLTPLLSCSTLLSEANFHRLATSHVVADTYGESAILLAHKKSGDARERTK